MFTRSKPNVKWFTCLVLVLLVGHPAALSQAVTAVTLSSGRASVHNLIRENLGEDMRYWHEKTRQGKEPLLPDDVYKLYGTWAHDGWIAHVTTMRLVLVLNNTWIHLKVVNGSLLGLEDGAEGGMRQGSIVSPADRPLPRGPPLDVIIRAASDAMATGQLQLPDSLFILHVVDNQERMGRRSLNNPVPLLALAKWWGDSHEEQDTDLLVPVMMDTPQVQWHFPWANKSDKVFFRGNHNCGRRDWHPVAKKLCSRTYFFCRALRGDGGVLDIHSTENVAINTPFCVANLTAAERVPISEHARHKYLLALDGFTAGYRLGQLLHTNSVVIKANESSYIEHFYRSLRPWVHYVSFWKDTPEELFPLMERLKAIDHLQPDLVQAIAGNGQRFAADNLTMEAKLRYLRAVLKAYNSLFGPSLLHHIRTQLAPRLFPNGLPA